jgi:hypothetical protein
VAAPQKERLSVFARFRGGLAGLGWKLGYSATMKLRRLLSEYVLLPGDGRAGRRRVS